MDNFAIKHQTVENYISEFHTYINKMDDDSIIASINNIVEDLDECYLLLATDLSELDKYDKSAKAEILDKYLSKFESNDDGNKPENAEPSIQEPNNNNIIEMDFDKNYKEKIYTCQYCNDEFPSKLRLIRHKRSHKADSKKYVHCKICKEKFKSQIRLNLHQSIHKNYGILKCNKCDKVFRFKNELTSHQIVHDKAIFSCKKCKRCFKREYFFNVHKCEMKNRKDSDWPVACGKCNKKFKHVSHLHSHERVHNRDNRPCCQYCNKAYTYAPNLRKHVENCPSKPQ